MLLMSRYRDQGNSHNEPSETTLIHEYINLMDTTVRTQSEILRSFNNNIYLMLGNVNLLFDRYYNWGDNSTTSEPRNRRTSETRNNRY